MKRRSENGVKNPRTTVGLWEQTVRQRAELYRMFCRGEIGKKEYLRRIRSLDRLIDRLEMELMPKRAFWEKEDAWPPRRP